MPVTVIDLATPYYELHACRPCADDNSSPTPLQYALQTLGMSLDVTTAIHGNRHFSEGWVMGIESIPHSEMEGDTGLCPVSLAESGDTKAWLIGFLAGRFAVENRYATPVCYVGDVDPADGHTPYPPK